MEKLTFKGKEFKGSEGEFISEDNFIYALHQKGWIGGGNQ